MCASDEEFIAVIYGHTDELRNSPARCPQTSRVFDFKLCFHFDGQVKQCHLMKRPVCAAWPVYLHTLWDRCSITVTVSLVRFICQVNSTAEWVHHAPAEGQLHCTGQTMDSGAIVKKKQANEKGHRPERQTRLNCGWMKCFKCRVLIRTLKVDQKPRATNSIWSGARCWREITFLWMSLVRRNSWKYLQHMPPQRTTH